jgi:hypothetical protein
LIPLEDLPVAFLAFFWGVGSAVAFYLPARVFEALALALALALVEGSLTDSSPRGRVKIRMTGIRMSPLMLGIGAIKLPKAYIQTNIMWDFKNTIVFIMTRVPYQVHFYLDMLGAHLRCQLAS